MNIFKIAFDDKQIDKEKLQKVLDKIQAAHTLWESVDEFVGYSRAGYYTWLEQNSDNIDLSGGKLPDGIEVVDFDVWYEQAMKALGGETVTNKKEEKILSTPEGFIDHDGSKVLSEILAQSDRQVEIVMRDGDHEIDSASNFRWEHRDWIGDIVAYRFLDGEPAPVRNPRPRYRKKRTPVPKRTVTAITINYKDGKQYVVKNPLTVYFDKHKLGINTEVVVTEGIVNSVYSEIATRLVKSIMIDEKDDETLIEFMPSLKKFRITGQRSRVSGAESFYKYFK